MSWTRERNNLRPFSLNQLGVKYKLKMGPMTQIKLDNCMFSITGQKFTKTLNSLWFCILRQNRVLLSSTPPQFSTSVQHKRAISFQPQKSLSSTTKTPQFNTPISSTPKIPQFHTLNPSVAHKKPLSYTNFSVFGVELRGFWC